MKTDVRALTRQVFEQEAAQERAAYQIASDQYVGLPRFLRLLSC